MANPNPADITSRIEILAGITPLNQASQYPTHYPEFGIGGLRRVDVITGGTSSQTCRNLIYPARRELGMLVFVEADSKYYQLTTNPTTPETTNTDWTEFSSGSSAATAIGRLTANVSNTSGSALAIDRAYAISDYNESTNTVTVSSTTVTAAQGGLIWLETGIAIGGTGTGVLNGIVQITNLTSAARDTELTISSANQFATSTATGNVVVGIVTRAGATNQDIAFDGLSLYKFVTPTSGGGGGTVTSVAVTAPITISGTPTVNPTIGISPATALAAGSISAADKSKLDASPVEWNNTNDVTANLAIGDQRVFGENLYINITGNSAGNATPANNQPDNDTTNWSRVGSVSNVTGTAPIQVANSRTTPTITIDPATNSLPGSMSASDKAKLDASPIEWNNTNDVSANLNIGDQRVFLENLYINITGNSAGNATPANNQPNNDAVNWARVGAVREVIGGGAVSITTPRTTPTISVANVTTTTNGLMLGSDKVKVDASPNAWESGDTYTLRDQVVHNQKLYIYISTDAGNDEPGTAAGNADWAVVSEAPAAFVKSTSIATDNTSVTFTDQDDATTTFTPPNSGGTTTSYSDGITFPSARSLRTGQTTSTTAQANDVNGNLSFKGLGASLLLSLSQRPGPSGLEFPAGTTNTTMLSDIDLNVPTYTQLNAAPRGWVSTDTYVAEELVFVATQDGRQVYQARSNIAAGGNQPNLNTANWSKLEPILTYDVGITYVMNDQVVFENKLYVCIVASSLNVAPTNTTNWSPLAGGEVNTASNLGTATDGEGLVVAKSGVDLPFKRIKAGTNIAITSETNDIVINATGTSTGEANTASNAVTPGTNEAGLVNTKVNVDLPFKVIKGGTNITVTQNANDVTITAAGGGGTTQTTSFVTRDSGFRNSGGTRIGASIGFNVDNSGFIWDINRSVAITAIDGAPVNLPIIPPPVVVAGDFSAITGSINGTAATVDLTVTTSGNDSIVTISHTTQIDNPMVESASTFVLEVTFTLGGTTYTLNSGTIGGSLTYQAHPNPSATLTAAATNFQNNITTVTVANRNPALVAGSVVATSTLFGGTTQTAGVTSFTGLTINKDSNQASRTMAETIQFTAAAGGDQASSSYTALFTPTFQFPVYLGSVSARSEVNTAALNNSAIFNQEGTFTSDPLSSNPVSFTWADVSASIKIFAIARRFTNGRTLEFKDNATDPLGNQQTPFAQVSAGTTNTEVYDIYEAKTGQPGPAVIFVENM